MHAALAARRDRWLLLLDNVTDAEALTGALPPASAGHVLITTRSAYWPPGIGLEVPVLDQPAAVGYLLARAAPDPPSEADAAAAAEVATELGGLPLALEQAAAYLQETSRTLPQYRVLLGQRRAELLARGQPWGYASRVASTWDLSFDALRNSAPDAVSLLRLASCLAPEAIPLGLLLGTGRALPAECRDTEACCQMRGSEQHADCGWSWRTGKDSQQSYRCNDRPARTPHPGTPPSREAGRRDAPVPLAAERFNLVIPAGQVSSREVQGLLKVLSSAWLLDQLASLPGYDPGRCGERIATLTWKSP